MGQRVQLEVMTTPLKNAFVVQVAALLTIFRYGLQNSNGACFAAVGILKSDGGQFGLSHVKIIVDI